MLCFERPEVGISQQIARRTSFHHGYSSFSAMNPNQWQIHSSTACFPSRATILYRFFAGLTCVSMESKWTWTTTEPASTSITTVDAGTPRRIEMCSRSVPCSATHPQTRQSGAHMMCLTCTCVHVRMFSCFRAATQCLPSCVHRSRQVSCRCEQTHRPESCRWVRVWAEDWLSPPVMERSSVPM